MIDCHVAIQKEDKYSIRKTMGTILNEKEREEQRCAVARGQDGTS